MSKIQRCHPMRGYKKWKCSFSTPTCNVSERRRENIYLRCKRQHLKATRCQHRNTGLVNNLPLNNSLILTEPQVLPTLSHEASHQTLTLRETKLSSPILLTVDYHYFLSQTDTASATNTTTYNDSGLAVCRSPTPVVPQ